MGKGIACHCGPQRSAGVALRGESELEEKKQSDNKAHNFSCFEVQGTFHSEIQNRGISGPRKRPMFPPKKIKTSSNTLSPMNAMRTNFWQHEVCSFYRSWDCKNLRVMLRNIVIKVKLDDVSLRRVCLIGLIEDKLHIELWIFTRNLLRSCFKWTAVWIFSWLRC